MKCRKFSVGLCSCSSRLWKFEYLFIGYFLLILIFYSSNCCAFAFGNATSTFLERCQMDCTLQRDLLTCGKYKAARWLHDIVREKEFSYGPFRIIRIPSMVQESVLPKLPRSRVFRSSIAEAFNFVRDAVEDLLTRRAIVYTIDNPTSARKYSTRYPVILDEDELEKLQSKKEEEEGDWRIFKKKKSLILPILILLNLLKLKLLLLPILLGVHFIKKLLLLGSLILPSLLAHLKVCKVQQPHQGHQGYPYHTWATAAEAPVDYPTGYGQEESGWSHRNDVQGHYGYPQAYAVYRHPYG